MYGGYGTTTTSLLVLELGSVEDWPIGDVFGVILDALAGLLPVDLGVGGVMIPAE